MHAPLHPTPACIMSDTSFEKFVRRSFSHLDTRLSQIDRSVSTLRLEQEKRFDRIDKNLAALALKTVEHDKRFDAIDKRFDEMLEPA